LQKRGRDYIKKKSWKKKTTKGRNKTFYLSNGPFKTKQKKGTGKCSFLLFALITISKLLTFARQANLLVLIVLYPFRQVGSSS